MSACISDITVSVVTRPRLVMSETRASPGRVARQCGDGHHVEDRRRFRDDRRRMAAACEPVERVDAVRGDPTDDPGDLEPDLAWLVVSGADRRGHRLALAESARVRTGAHADRLGGQGHLWGEALVEAASCGSARAPRGAPPAGLG